MRALTETLLTYLPVLILLLGLNLFVVWRRFRSRRELVRRVNELEGLTNAGRLLVEAALEFDQLCELIVREAQAIIENQTIQLGFFEGNEYHVKILQDGQHRLPPVTVDLSDGRGLVGWVRDHKRSLLVRDFQRQRASLPAEPIHLHLNKDEPPAAGSSAGGSAILIPLLRGTKVIGVLAAHHEQADQFNEHHEGRLTILANQAAAALANARLFAAERQRTAQIELLGEITRKINAIEDVDRLFAQVVQLTQQTFSYFQVNIYGVMDLEQEVILLASSDSRLGFGDARFENGQGMIGEVLTSGLTLCINMVRDDPRFLTEVDNPEVTAIWQQVEAALVIPLEMEGRRFGVIEILHDQPQVFSPADQEMLESLAGSISLAIQKAQQLARQLEQSWLTAARLQMANAIGEAVNLDDLVDKGVHIVPLLSGAEQVGVLVWDDDLNAYRPAGCRGLLPGEEQRFAQRPWKLGDWPAVDAVHVGRETYLTSRPAPWQQAGVDAAPKPLLLMPLLAESRYQGILFVSQLERLPIQSGRMLLDDPDTLRLDLLYDIGRQMAAGIERHKLLTAQEEEAWVNTALLQVAEAVNSLIDLNDILNTIARLVTLLVGVESCVILVIDETTRLLRPVASFGLNPMGRGMLDTWELSLDEALQMASAPNNSENGPHHLAQEFYHLVLPPWLRRTLQAEDGFALPLRSQGRPVGWLMVGSDPAGGQSRRPLTGRRVNILVGIAQQAAVAVTTHQLYREAAERDRLEQELQVAQRLQRSLLPAVYPDIPGCEIAHHWQSARQVGGDFYDFMPLSDGSWAIAIADVADKGFPAAIYMAVARTILRVVASSRTDPAKILKRTNTLLIDNTGYDQFVTIFLGVWDAQRQQLRYACGGHNPAIWVQNGGRTTDLQAPGMVLGLFEEAVYQTQRVRLAAGDVVLFFTDGVSEAINANYDEFGEHRLTAAARESQKDRPSAIIHHILQAVEEFVGSTSQSDDLTLVVMKVR